MSERYVCRDHTGAEIHVGDRVEVSEHIYSWDDLDVLFFRSICRPLTLLPPPHPLRRLAVQEYQRPILPDL